LSPEYHGFNGQLVVEDIRGKHEVTEKVMESMLKCGFNYNEDTNGENQEGVGYTQVTMNNGRRWSASDAYLSQAAVERPNFFIRTKAQVTRILFEGKRAIGAEFVEDGKKRIVKARKEVILAAGAINSPQILLNSGIGPSDELQKLNIPVIHHLEGVGKNLQDHVFFPISHQTNLSSLHSEETLPSVISWVKDGKGPLASSIGEVVGFMKSSKAIKENLPADLEFGAAPAYFINHGLTPEKNPKNTDGITIGCVLLRPKSSGFVKLKSNNPLDTPHIQPNYFSNSEDLDLLVEAFHKIREIFKTKPISDFIQQEVFPGESTKSDEEIREYIKNELMTLYHPTSTCKMGSSSDKTSVVGSNLKIHGLKNIRIVDASVFPNIISGHTNAPVIAIAEKASDLIKKEHFTNYQ
jgi:choline dehydrogenase